MTSRRSFLAAASAIGALPLAGCVSDSDILNGDDADEDEEPEPDEDDAGEETDENDEPETDEETEDDDGDEDDEEPEPDEDDAGEETDENDEPETDEETEDDDSDEDDDADEEDGELADLPGEPIDDFEDVDAWSPLVGQEEITEESEEAYAGTNSARITAPDDEDSALVYRSFPDGLDLSERGVSIAIKYTGLEQFDLSVQLLATNERDRVNLRRVLTGAEDRWQRIDLGIDSVTGEPDLEEVREIRIIGRRRGDEEGDLDFVVDDLRAADSPGTGAVMLLFDGILESHYTTAFEQLEEFGFRGVAAAMPEAIGNDGRLTIDELQEMAEAGWDVISRPRTGAQFLRDYSPEQQEGLIRRSQGFLESRGFEDGARHFQTPRNLLTPESHDFVREYHEQAFRFGGTPNSLPITDHHNLGFFSGEGGSDSVDYVDLAAAYNQLAVLHFIHIDDDDEGIDEDYFEDFLEHIDSLDVEVVTASDLLDADLDDLAAEDENDDDADDGENDDADDTDDTDDDS